MIPTRTDILPSREVPDDNCWAVLILPSPPDSEEYIEKREEGSTLSWHIASSEASVNMTEDDARSLAIKYAEHVRAVQHEDARDRVFACNRSSGEAFLVTVEDEVA